MGAMGLHLLRSTKGSTPRGPRGAVAGGEVDWGS
jgi:hypothetical protein